MIGVFVINSVSAVGKLSTSVDSDVNVDMSLLVGVFVVNCASAGGE